MLIIWYNGHMSIKNARVSGVLSVSYTHLFCVGIIFLRILIGDGSFFGSFFGSAFCLTAVSYTHLINREPAVQERIKKRGTEKDDRIL